MSPDIEREIDERFAEPDRPGVRQSLSTLHSDSVRLSVLRLSRGKLDRVHDLVQAAGRDYRDVIAWASQPTRTYWVGILRKGPAWTPSDENGRTHLSPHLLREWKTGGNILAGGWFLDFGDARGLYLFRGYGRTGARPGGVGPGRLRRQAAIRISSVACPGVARRPPPRSVMWCGVHAAAAFTTPFPAPTPRNPRTAP